MLKGKRLGFIYPNEYFVKPIISHFSDSNEVISLHYKDSSYEKIEEIIKWADLVFFDWAAEALIRASRDIEKGGTKIVCRLHSNELFNGKADNIEWPFVDRIIFVNRSTKLMLSSQKQIKDDKCVVINNGVDLTSFKYKPRERNYKIGFSGNLNMWKNFPLALQCIQAASQHLNSRYTLHIAGELEDARSDLYYNYYKTKSKLPIVEYGRLSPSDMPNWYNDMDIILSTSLFEGCPVSIFEGMACGCVPIIHRWPGVEYLYDPCITFDSIAVFMQILHNLESSYKEVQKVILEEAKYHNINKMFKEIDSVLEGVLDDN